MDNNTITIFAFKEKEVRILEISNEPWFVVKDICDILGLTNTTETLKNLPKKWKDSVKLNTQYGRRLNIIISEPGVYRLIMRSNKPVAEKFQDWICGDVLPTIRKTGEYKVQEAFKKDFSDQELELYNKECEIERLTRLTLRRKRRKYPKGNCIYILTHKQFDNHYKIGKTKNFDDRYLGYVTAVPDDHEILFHRNVIEMDIIETLILKAFNSKKVNNPRREWFELDDPDILINAANKVCDFVEEFIETYSPTPDFEIPKPIPPPLETTKSKKNVDLLPTKPCNDCKAIKSLEEFNFAKEHRDQRENVCKICKRVRQEKVIEKQRAETDFPTKKSCNICHTNLPLDDFYRDKNSPDGRMRRCKNCHKLKQSTPQTRIVITEKCCTTCKITKSVSEFYVQNKNPDGYKIYCKDCSRAQARGNYSKNKEKYLQTKREKREKLWV